RRAAEAALGLVELGRERLERAEEDLVREEAGRRPEPLRLTERLADLLRGGHDFAAPVRPRLRERLEEPWERWQAVPLDGRVIGAAVEGLAVGREEDRHRPPAVARQRLHGLHVDLVDDGLPHARRRALLRRSEST